MPVPGYHVVSTTRLTTDHAIVVDLLFSLLLFQLGSLDSLN